MELDKLTDLHFSAHLVDMMLEYRAIGTRYISLQQSCSRGNSLLLWCTTPIEAESSLGPDSHHPIISLSGIPSAVIVLRILHPILASTLCAANPLARIAERRCCTALAESEIRLWWWPRYVRA